MESGGEGENSLRDNLEVSVTVEDLKFFLGRLGDLEDPYFKHLEVIREFEGLCLAKCMLRKRLMCKVVMINRWLAEAR